ncbi:MAG: hypothetical protein QHC40_05975 [Sphingobium sp.]|nr:hypothetical protein [Sphingobium sp.]
MPLGLAAIDDLIASFDSLRAAMDEQDAAAIDAASAQVARSAAAVRAIGAWRDEPAVKDRLTQLRPQVESLRVRSHLMADHAAQRLSLLAAHGAETAPLTYGR